MLICILAISANTYSQTFTNVAATTGLNFGGAKDGGIAWGDINNDGCLDLAINTSTNNTGGRSRLFLSDCNTPNPTFTDVTATYINGFRQQRCERSVSIGDYNNDGYVDIARNTHNRFEVYLNKGPTATPAYSFGDATQNPNLTITTVPGGMNVEGFGWVDYNNDGWLDLILENHNFGIDIYENPADGSANFFHATPNGSNVTRKGLPRGGTTGDYMALTDYDDDGDIDILARKEDTLDLWTNNGNGTFSVNTSFDVQATNGNKGGVLFCDFDNDGDFDIYWSDNGANQIYEQTGLNSGTFVATGEPATSSATTITASIDGCACGDVDNDGDMDLFLAGGNAAATYLFENTNAATMQFSRNNMGIAAGGNLEGCGFADYDNDGDLDLYIQRNGAANYHYRNSTNDNNYLKIAVKRDLGSSVYRDDLGATAVLKDCNGNVISGIREVNGIRGHGSQDPAIIHFGVPSGNATRVLVEIRFTKVSGTRAILDTTIVPVNYTDQTVTIYTPSGAGAFTGCALVFALPVELLSFEAQKSNAEVQLDWSTASEINCDYYLIQRSRDGETWEDIQKVTGAGNSNIQNHYQEFDRNPYNGINHYRLKQYDFNGKYHYSDISSVVFSRSANPTLFPNPTANQFTISSDEPINTVIIFDARGRIVYRDTPHSNKLQVNQALANGMYFIRIETRAGVFNEQLVISRR